MGAWVEAHEEGPPEDERAAAPGDGADDENVVDFSTRRLREWLRGMFGGEADQPPDDDR
jgi:hypothetical protein